MKIKISSLLMEAGISYNKRRLHKAGYFRELLATNPDIDESLRSLLRQCREMVVRLDKTENAKMAQRYRHPRSSKARRGSFCPLDKDLSWKSASRKGSFQYELGRSSPREVITKFNDSVTKPSCSWHSVCRVVILV